MAIVPFGVTEAVTRYTSNPGVIRDIVDYARQAGSVWEFGQLVRREFGSMGDSISAAVEMVMEEADASWQTAVGAFNEMAAADARRMNENQIRADRVNNERANRAVANGWNQPLASSTEVAVDNHGEIVESNNGGRNPVNSGGTPVSDVGVGGRPRGGLRGTNQNPMEGASDPGGEPVAAAARSSGGGPGGSVSKETPISPYPNLSYGLQETHTTILPWTGWVTAAIADLSAKPPLQLKLRTNSIYDMLNITTLASPAIDTAFTTNGFYMCPATSAGKTAATSALTYPDISSAGAAVTEQPAWRNFWTQVYEFYTVLGMEYKITVVNPHETAGASWIIGEFMDSYSATAGVTDNVFPTTSYLQDAMCYKGVKWRIINPKEPGNPGKNVEIYEGRVRPGQIRRNIVNDGEVKTWTSTASGTVPNLKEELILNLWRAPFSHLTGGATGSGNTVSTSSYVLMFQIEMKMIVQFKDLKTNVKFPTRGNTTQDITITMNEDSTAAGSVLMRQ